MKTEATYRAVKMDSSSSLKEFCLDRKKYYRKYVLNETVEDTINKAATIGRIVETLLLEPEEFDSRFYLSVCSKAPTGLMLDFVNALSKHTAESTDKDTGTVTRTFEQIAQDAYVDSGFKIKFEAVLTKFIGSDAEIYYKEMREVQAKGLTVVTTEDIANADRTVTELKTNFVTKEVINLVNSSRYTVLNQFQVEGYSVNGHLFKSMMDKIVIDHNEKTIQVYDLKCVWAVENFYEEYYLYRRSYIQAYLYFTAAESLAKQERVYGYEAYKALYPKFIVCDSTNYFNPLIYTMTDVDIDDAYNGFEHKGRIYPGVNALIQNLDWAIANNTWNISKENYINNGVVNIR
jgi:hypothetical protein